MQRGPGEAKCDIEQGSALATRTDFCFRHSYTSTNTFIKDITQHPNYQTEECWSGDCICFHCIQEAPPDVRCMVFTESLCNSPG